MSGKTITCTNCGEEIEITEALTRQINRDLKFELQKQFDKKLAAERESFDAKREPIEKHAAENAAERAGAAAKLELEDLCE